MHLLFTEYLKKCFMYFQGVYIASGMDTSIIKKTNFPKKFFYGTYKFRYFYSRKNEIYGCFICVIDLKRPWETL